MSSTFTCIAGFGNGVDEVSGDAKITELDRSLFVREDVGRLHVPVDHLQLPVQVVQGGHNGEGNLHFAK